jgi:hypothetical protein
MTTEAQAPSTGPPARTHPGNVVRLRVRREGQRVAIGEGLISDGIEIDISLLAAKGIEDWPGDTPSPRRSPPRRCGSAAARWRSPTTIQ